MKETLFSPSEFEDLAKKVSAADIENLKTINQRFRSHLTMSIGGYFQNNDFDEICEIAASKLKKQIENPNSSLQEAWDKIVTDFRKNGFWNKPIVWVNAIDPKNVGKKRASKNSGARLLILFINGMVFCKAGILVFGSRVNRDPHLIDQVILGLLLFLLFAGPLFYAFRRLDEEDVE